MTVHFEGEVTGPSQPQPGAVGPHSEGRTEIVAQRVLQAYVDPFGAKTAHQFLPLNRTGSIEDMARQVAGRMYLNMTLTSIATDPVPEAFAHAIFAQKALQLMAQQYRPEITSFLEEFQIPSGRFISLPGRRESIFVPHPHAETSLSNKNVLNELKASHPEQYEHAKNQPIANISTEEEAQAQEMAQQLEAAFPDELEKIYQEALQILQASQETQRHPPTQRTQQPHEKPALPIRTPVSPKGTKPQVETTSKTAQARREERDWRAHFEKLMHTFSAEQKRYFYQMLEGLIEEVRNVRDELTSKMNKADELKSH